MSEVQVRWHLVQVTFLAVTVVTDSPHARMSLLATGALSQFSQLPKNVTTNTVSKPFGEHPSGYFFFTRGGNVAFFAAGQDRKPPAVSTAPTDAERAELYKTMIAAFTGTYKVEGSMVNM